MTNRRFRRVKFNKNGGLSIGPVWYAQPKNQRLIFDGIMIVIMLLLST
jgi:hypothetical protein